MYSQVLEAKGVTVQRKFNIGARELYLKALEDGSIDLLPEYNGALLARYLKGAPEGSPARDGARRAEEGDPLGHRGPRPVRRRTRTPSR